MSTNNDYPQGIILDAGDDVEARFERATSAVDREGTTHPVLVITLLEVHAGDHQLDGRERSWWVLRTAQRSQLARLRPKQGERIRIQMAAAKKKSSNGRQCWPDRISAPERQPEVIGWDHALWGGDDEADIPTDQDDGAPLPF